MRARPPGFSAAALVVCLLLTSPAVLGRQALDALPTDGVGSVAQAYPNSSWALGIVVPEGSQTADGSKVRWEDVSNVTVEATLPNITLPDRVVYAVASVMTEDGSVMQAAAGAYPNRSVWLAYSWMISGADSGPVTYSWILNGSKPEMGPASKISISIYRDADLWNLRVEDEASGKAVDRPFPDGIAPTLKAGDQEVFALESYSRSGATFRNMGNLTMEGLKLDGRMVTGGFYAYGDWDPTHSLVFVVGSSGSSPPIFISLTEVGSGSFAWGFTEDWVGAGGSLDPVWTLVIIAAVAGSTALALAIYWVSSRKKVRRKPAS